MNHPFTPFTPVQRQRRTHLAALGLALLLAGCQTPPPPPPPPPPPAHTGLSAAQQQWLREQGFEEGDGAWTLMAPAKLLFAVDTDRMNAQQEHYLLQLGHALQRMGLQTLRVEGHTDETGTPQYNQQLSERRAQRVAEVLVRAGLPAHQIQTTGWGSTRPLPMVAGEHARRENRRVAIIVPSP